MRTTVNHLEFGPQSPPPGSVASLDLPVGTAVVDDKSGGTLGYWDGQGLAEEMPRIPRDPAKSTRNYLPILIYLGVGAVMFAVFGAVRWYRNRGRAG